MFFHALIIAGHEEAVQEAVGPSVQTSSEGPGKC